MAAVSLATFRSRALERAHMENSLLASTTELNALVNSEAAELWDEVVSRFEDEKTTSLQFTISSGNTYSPTSAVFKLCGLDFQEGSDWYAVPRFAFNERNRRAYRYGYRARERRYRWIGSQIYITPEDNATGTYRLWYVPAYTALASDADTIDWPNGWEEFVIDGVAALLLRKEGSLDIAAACMQRKEALRARIRAMAANRDLANANKIIDVHRRAYEWDEL
jgi:hypothetical protein